MARVDYDEQSAYYDKGRGLPDEAFAVWMATARRHLGPQLTRVLDLGCGTGMWSAAIADACDTDVVGVEPSAGMLARATAKPHPRIRHIAGSAEHIPLRDNTCDGAWLSAVIHHFADLAQAAKELRRTLTPGSPVLIRGAFPGRLPIGSLDRFFPATAKELETYPSVDETFEAFSKAGFSDLSVEKVTQVTAPNLTKALERVKARADTALKSISDEDFEAGLRAIEHAAKTEHGPVTDKLDLVVLR